MSRPFRFKRFEVHQQGCAMKVGTDGVLLGAWCSIDKLLSPALDVGTGSGVIAMMLVQRGEQFGLEVDSVEIEQQSYLQASENFSASEWTDKLKVENISYNDFQGREGGYGLIVSNPPFFNDSLLPPHEERAQARHTTTMTHEMLISKSSFLLKDEGRFAVIIPYSEADSFIELGECQHLYLSRRTDVYTTSNSLPKRSLLEFIYKGSDITVTHDSLVVQNAPMDYTAEYMELTRDFYLSF